MSSIEMQAESEHVDSANSIVPVVDKSYSTIYCDAATTLDGALGTPKFEMDQNKKWVHFVIPQKENKDSLFSQNTTREYVGVFAKIVSTRVFRIGEGRAQIVNKQ